MNNYREPPETGFSLGLLPSYNLLDVSSVALRLKFSLSRFVPDIFTFFYLLLIYIFQNTGKYSLLEEK